MALVCRRSETAAHPRARRHKQPLPFLQAIEGVQLTGRPAVVLRRRNDAHVLRLLTYSASARCNADVIARDSDLADVMTVEHMDAIGRQNPPVYRELHL